jgi:hypothetical protein
LRHEGDRFSVLAPDAALARLDQVWDDYFQYSAGTKAAVQS